MGAVLLKSILCVEKTVRNNGKSLTGKKKQCPYSVKYGKINKI